MHSTVPKIMAEIEWKQKSKVTKSFKYSLLAIALSGLVLSVILDDLLKEELPSPFDKNHDGVLSYKEFTSAMTILFNGIDQDKNQVLSETEIANARENTRLPLPKVISFSLRLIEIDVNDDQQISKREFLGEQPLKAYFRVFDKNQNNSIERAESDAALMDYLFP